MKEGRGGENMLKTADAPCSLKKTTGIREHRFLPQSVRREEGRAKSRLGNKKGLLAKTSELGLGPSDEGRKMAILTIVTDTAQQVLSSALCVNYIR